MNRSIRTAVVVGGLVALWSLQALPAWAQSPPPPVGTCSPASPAVTNLGTHNINETFATNLCGPWVPGTFGAFNFNGLAAGGKTIDATGAVSPRFFIFPDGRVNVDDIVQGVCGTNTLTVTGTGAGGVALIKQVTFAINCSTFGGQFLPSNFFPGGVFPGSGAFSFPGSPGLVISPSQANQQQQQEQQQSISVPAAAGGSGGGAPVGQAAPVQASQGRVAFTGANVIRWSVAALILMAIGAFLVWHSRRRRPLFVGGI